MFNTNLTIETIKVTAVANQTYDIIEINAYRLAGWCYIFCYIKAKATGTADLVTISTGLPQSITKYAVRSWEPAANNVESCAMGFYLEGNELKGRWGERSSIYQLSLAYPCR